MTPTDPIFLVIPILQVIRPDDDPAGIYQLLDDVFEEASSKVVIGSTTMPQEDIMSRTWYDCIADAFAKDGLMDDRKEDLLKLDCARSACELVNTKPLALRAKYECVQIVASFVHPFIYAPRFVRSPGLTSLETHVRAVKAEVMVVALSGVLMAKSQAAIEEDSDNKKRKARSKESTGCEIPKKVGVSKVVEVSIYFQNK